MPGTTILVILFSLAVYAGKSIWTLKFLGRECQSWPAGSREQRQHYCAMESWWQTDPHYIRVLVEILYDALSGPSYQHCWGLAYIVPLPKDRDPQAYSELLLWEKAAISGLRSLPRASVIWSPTAKGQTQKESHQLHQRRREANNNISVTFGASQHCTGLPAVSGPWQTIPKSP